MTGTIVRPSGAGPDEVAARLATARRRIAAAGGDPARVEVVAVTKGFGLPAVRSALACGLVQVGENYADELVEKAAALAAEPGAGGDLVAALQWHFLGPIQRNKLPRLAPIVHCYEGVDRLAEGEAIATRSPGAAVLVEVRTVEDPGRPGVAPAAVAPLVAALRRLALDVRGLMTVAPAGGGEPARQAFASVRRLADDLGLAVRSMGMTDDLELAVAEGATCVRLGRALFGARPGAVEVSQ